MSTVDVFFDQAIFNSGGVLQKPAPEIVENSDYMKAHRLYVVPPAVQSDIAYKKIMAAYMYVYALHHGFNISYAPLLTPLLYESITSTTQLPKYSELTYFNTKEQDTDPTYVYRETTYEVVKSIFDNGAVFKLEYSNTSCYAPPHSNGPFVRLELGDNLEPTVELLYPKSNSEISKSVPTTFQWNTSIEEGETIKPVTIESITLTWGYVDSNQLFSVDLQNTNQYTFPAETFETGTIQWRLVVTANSGVATTSEWIKVAVAEPVSKSQAIFPQNTIVDGSKPVEFKWEHIISNGTVQTGFDLQISRDLQTWTTIVSKETAETSTTVPENTFTSGDLYWSVRTYNLDGVAGDWSEPAHCIVIAAPSVPAVTITEAAPRFSIRWHQHGQQGYEIMLGETVIAKKYGASSAYTHTKHLPPGAYSVKVRIQNQYGLWSGWGEALLNIAASAEPAISLSVQVETHIVQLSWETEGAYDSFLVYRNGVQIAEVTNHQYQDQFAAGAAVYQVRGIYSASGECGLSPQEQVFIEIKNMLIFDINDPHWIELSHSTSSLRSTSMSRSHSVAYSHFIGSALPSADIGEAEYQALELDCAWKNADLTQAHAFENLTGRSVVIKTITGRLIAAVMDSVRSEENRFWTAYQAHLTLIDWEETTT